jgi:putative tricarboxylic transport membrane protein
MTNQRWRRWSLAALAAFMPSASFAWAPSQPVEIVVPAGAGGGGDQMAHAIEEALKEVAPSVTVSISNKKGGSGAEGYMYVKGKSGDAHTLVITLASCFTLPVVVGVPFKHSDFTPLARLALDEFVLWVSADNPAKTPKDYLATAKGEKKMAGTGSGQEDQLVTIMIEQASGAKFKYVPLGGGGDVAKAVAGGDVDSSVNNPAEAVKLWKEGKVKPLGVARDKRLTIEGWTGIPTLKEQGVDVHYEMVRGVFGAPGMPADATKFYVDLLQKAYKSKSFQAYLKNGALTPAWLTGADLSKWMAGQDEMHTKLLTDAGLKQK